MNEWPCNNATLEAPCHLAYSRLLVPLPPLLDLVRIYL
jgi:hypothetical protein